MMWHWLLCGLLLICSSLHAQDKPCDITIGSCHRMPLSAEGSGILDKIVHESFKRIGKESCIVALPCERSLMAADSGDLDGDLLRIPAAIEQRYPHLRPVPEMLYPFSISVFTLRKDIRVEKLADLAPLRVGFIIGWKILEDQVHAANILRVRGPEELFTLLADQRADVVIYERLTGMKMLEDLGLKHAQTLEPPLFQTVQHLVLHERHNKLLEPLARALRTMKAEGRYDREFRTAVAASTAPLTSK